MKMTAQHVGRWRRVPDPRHSWLIVVVVSCLASHVRAEDVECVYERRVEDYMDDPNDTYDNEYGVCTTVAGSGRRLADGTYHPKTLYIPDEGDYEQFTPGDRLFLDVDPKEDDADVEPLSQYDRLGHARPAWTQFSSNDSYAVRVKAVKHIVPSDAARRQLHLGDAFPPKDLISIRATYSDVGGPDYCDYNCVYQNTWGTPTQAVGYAGNLSRFLHDSSFGRLRWPASLGKVVNVNMGKASKAYGACDGGKIASDVVAVADAAGHAASGYTHVEIFLPDGVRNTIGCTWGGYAQVGCSRPESAPRAGACWSLIRSSLLSTRAHEFGHNIGLGHASSAGSEYGDKSGAPNPFTHLIPNPQPPPPTPNPQPPTPTPKPYS